MFWRFVRGVSSTGVGALGVALVNAAFASFLVVEALRILGVVRSAYVGMLSYLLLPALFVVGLVLIPVGWWVFLRRVGRPWREVLGERFGPELVAPGVLGSRLLLVVAGLTAVNLVFLGGGSLRMLHFMEEPVFCGTACHSVMSPEWTTYQDSPHAHVRCVDCHVGEGTGALVDSKLNGAWQLVSITFDLYERPIPTPVHQLRPARETCESCHWPEAVYGDRVHTRTSYQLDRESTPSHTTLVLHVGSGRGQGIHWHVHPDNQVRYASVDDERERMLWTEARQADGALRRYEDRRLAADPTGDEAVRVVDCVDCHNRATHVYEDPEDAADRLIAAGEVDLPHAKRIALAALTGSWRDEAAAMASIEREVRRTTEELDPAAAPGLEREQSRAVAALQGAYQRNIHHRMRVNWGSYPDHLGHTHRRGGCFRCHHEDMVDDQGQAVRYDCELCHDLLAWDSPTPFAFATDEVPRR